ncbi:hypothetical protein ABW20_dc0101774 [Dactylellina cionopaga]|nr:hypothetical protein ABW20_dc0101774 [Dactylellina cionopaga]
MSFPFLAKGSTSSNAPTQNDKSKLWADKTFTSSTSSSSAVQQNEFRTPSNQLGQIEGEVDYESFLTERGPDEGISAVGPYSLLNEQFSPDIEFQKSIDGLDVVGLLEVMDTQETQMESFMVGRGGEKSLGVDEEVEDPVEWLGVTRGYTDEVWGEEETIRDKGKGKEAERVEQKIVKGKGKGIDMKSRL